MNSTCWNCNCFFFVLFYSVLILVLWKIISYCKVVATTHCHCRRHFYSISLGLILIYWANRTDDRRCSKFNQDSLVRWLGNAFLYFFPLCCCCFDVPNWFFSLVYSSGCLNPVILSRIQSIWMWSVYKYIFIHL